MLNHYDLPPQPDKRQPKVTLLDVVICLLAAFLVVAFCMSCSPKIKDSTMAANMVKKANDAFPDTVAHITRELYPCIEKGKEIDSSQYLSVKRRLDMVVQLYEAERKKLPIRIKEYVKDTAKCIEQCNEKIDGLNQLLDLQEVTIVDLKNQLIDLQNHPIIVTKKIEDSAKIKVLTDSYNRADAAQLKFFKLAADNEKKYFEMKDKRNDWRMRFWWVILAVVSYLVLRIGKSIKPTSLLKYII